jgi:hypothetical protein
MKKKILSAIFSAVLTLAFLLCITLPAKAVTVYDITDTGTVLIALPGDYLVSGSSNTRSITVDAAGTVNLILSNVVIDVSALNEAALAVGAGTTLNLTLVGNSSLTGGSGGAGVFVPTGATLNITADSTGSLAAAGGPGSAGIGGGGLTGCGTVTISGGTVTAQGGELGAGIGVSSGEGGTVTISGGTVIATGGSNGAGIGGGATIDMHGMAAPGLNYGSIAITGGAVTATGGNFGAGIGGGFGASPGGTVAISGGTVTAVSGWHGAGGIGGGSGLLSITGGSVNADSIGYAVYTDAAHTTLGYPVTLTGLPASAAVAWAPEGGSTSACNTNADGKLHLWLPESSPGETGFLWKHSPAFIWRRAKYRRRRCLLQT